MYAVHASHEECLASLAMQKRSEAEVPRQALSSDAAGLRSGTERSQSSGQVRRRPLGEETHWRCAKHEEVVGRRGPREHHVEVEPGIFDS